jgi:hypothetical protein
LKNKKKAMVFDLKGQLLPLANVRPETNGLMLFTYDLLVKCINCHGMVYIELCLHESLVDNQGEFSHKYVQLGAWNKKYVTLCIK